MKLFGNGKKAVAQSEEVPHKGTVPSRSEVDRLWGAYRKAMQSLHELDNRLLILEKSRAREQTAASRDRARQRPAEAPARPMAGAVTENEWAALEAKLHG